MPDRYALFEIGDLSKRFSLPNGVPAGVKKSYNISPAQSVPAIYVKNDARIMERMILGFVPANAKDTNSIFRCKTHQARSEDVFGKPTWQNAIRTKRCLIPANGFYEWRKSPAGKHAFYIHPTTQPLFAFAGIYSEWTDPEGIAHGICAIITTASDSGSDQIPSRLPVIVDPDDEAAWLDPNVSDFSTLIRIMRPLDPSQLIVTRVSNEVSSIKSDSAKLIAPIQRTND